MNKDESDFLREQAEAEQNAAGLGKLMVPYLSEFYKGCLEAGFDATQAFELTKVSLQSMLARSG